MNKMPFAKIPYDDLIQEYDRLLVDDLRGFGFDREILDLWVPDENLVESLRSLIDAVSKTEADGVEISIGNAIIKNLDLDGLAESLRDVAAVEIERRAEGIVLTARPREGAEDGAGMVDWAWKVDSESRRQRAEEWVRLGEAAASRPREMLQPTAIAEAYRPAIEAFAAAPQHEGEPPRHDGVAVRGTCDGLALTCRIDPDSHRILDATFAGARTDTARGIAEGTCRVIVGRTILDAAHHGANLLHSRCISDRANNGVGIVLPHAVDAAFAFADEIAKQALADYRETTGYAERVNDFDVGPSAEWAGLSEEERYQRLRDAIEARGPDYGIDPRHVTITDLEFDVRVEVLLAEEIDGDRAPPCILSVERLLKETVESRLEVINKERKDANVLRRLSDQKKGKANE